MTTLLGLKSLINIATLLYWLYLKSSSLRCHTTRISDARYIMLRVV